MSLNPSPRKVLSQSAIVIFARAPVAGRAKTRLIPLLGARGAADLQRALLLDTAAKVARLRTRAEKWIYAAGGAIRELAPGAPWRFGVQRGRDLGTRLENAFSRLLQHNSRVVIIGTDSPQLTPRLLRLALSELQSCDAVLGPCPDGGFYLVGLARASRGLFRGVRLGTRHAFGDVQKAILPRGLSCSVLPEIPDIDRPRDLREFEKELSKNSSLRVSSPALRNFLRGQAACPHPAIVRRAGLRPATAPSKSSRRR